jgi:NADPH:quinone reductase-like Zn-dependent oxidoreductase
LRDISDGESLLEVSSLVKPPHDKLSETVITTASKSEKLAWLASMEPGATHTVNYKTQDFAKEVGAITNGKGVNLVIDFVGKSHWEKNIASLAVDGRMVILSMLSGVSRYL